MWISGKAQEQIHALQVQASNWQADYAHANGALQRTLVEMARLKADLDWFKLRLNQVEQERAQLIHSAIGVKISVPEFVPAYDPEKAFNALPDLSSVGGDAAPDPVSALTPDVDYSQLPGYRRSE